MYQFILYLFIYVTIQLLDFIYITDRNDQSEIARHMQLNGSLAFILIFVSRVLSILQILRSLKELHILYLVCFNIYDYLIYNNMIFLFT